MSEVKKKLLKRKVMAMEGLPSIPTHVRKLMTMLRDPEADANDVVDQIRRDLQLVAQILKFINSSLFGLPTKIESVEQAVSLLGFSKIWDILMSTSVMTLMGKSEKELWEHSYTSSVFVKEFMTRENVPCSSNLPLIMLLHDIGKLVLMTASSSSYELIKNMSRSNNVPTYRLEERHIGVTHMEAGAWLLEAWDLDMDYSLHIIHHHEQLAMLPEELKLDIAVMKLADYCDNSARSKPQDDYNREELSLVGLDHIDLDEWIIHQRNFTAGASAP